MKQHGFTLAEVLITLTIIGVIAALTVPTLMKKWKENILVNQLKETYAILTNAYQMAINEHGTPEDWDINDARKLFNYFKPYLKIEKECGYNVGCFASQYKALFNDTYSKQFDTYQYLDTIWKIKLANGSSVLFDEYYRQCRDVAANTGPWTKRCGRIFVDVNGTKGPNKAGLDLFAFWILPQKIHYPDAVMHSKGWVDHDGEICKYNNTSKANGTYCTGYALQHGKMDYLRRDISND